MTTTQTSINLPAAWLVQGWVPPICVRHGGPSTRRDRRSFYTKTPTWVVLLIFVALMLALVVALCVRGTVTAEVPSCDRCASERRRFKWWVAAAWLGDVVLLVGITQLGAVGFVLWLVATVAALCWSFAGDRSRVTGTVSKDRLWVALKGVHPTFAAAINGALVPPPASQPLARSAASPGTSILPRQ